MTALGEHNDNFVCCPPEALDWRTRRYRIMEEIVEYGPDIICLQVTAGLFFCLLNTGLNPLGRVKSLTV